MKVLIVDDAHDTLQLFRMVLTMQDFEVRSATNGVEALQSVHEEAPPFDAMLLDVQMPQMDGWEVLRRIRQLPQGQDSYIVMFSAYDTKDENLGRAQELGADSFLQKPVLPQALIEVLLRGVEHKRSG